jgi:hypothetical protein
MSLKQNIIFLTGIIISQFAGATPPVEVIGSCKNSQAVNSSVTMTKLTSPAGLGDDETDCLDHYESTVGGFNYGAIMCNDESYIIVKGTRIKLNTAVNHSINPSIKPGADIAAVSDWRKVEFNSISYLCVSVPLSMSGDGADVSQYYIVENAYNSSTPIVYYYFLNKDLMPLTSTD